MRSAFLLLVLLALAGCSDGGSREPSESTGPSTGGGDAAPGTPEVIRGTGTITASGPVLSIGGESTAFTVDAAVTLLHAEIEWDDPVQDVDLALASPEAGMTGTAQNFDHIAAGGSPGAPDSPHSLTIVGPQEGDWQASAFANGAAAQLEYRVAITLFRGEDSVPAGYTALQ